MKTPPYTTPKGVRIGHRYVPPARTRFSADELRIQRALLGERKRIDWDGIVIVVVMAVVALAFLFWSNT
jgi:hypothetical protein